MFYVLCLAIALAVVSVDAAPASAAADADYLSGLSYLEDSTNINFGAALTLFHSALAQDPTHTAANVFAAILEFGQMGDDTVFVNIRSNLSKGGNDSLTLSGYLSQFGRGVEFDSMVDYRDYYWGSDALPSVVQAVLTKIVNDSIPHIESHLSAALSSGGSFAFPRNLIDDAGSADTYEIDTTEILLMHSALLTVKAVLVVLTSYDIDMTDTPRDIPDTISFDAFRSHHPRILTQNHTWDSAWSFLKDADTKFTKAVFALRSEGDAQDSDFIRRSTVDTRSHRFITDTDLDKIESWLADTIANIIGGDSITSDTEEAYAEIGGVSVVPKKLFQNPPDRYDFNDLRVEEPRGRFFEWNDFEVIDPTFGGILPGMTANKLYLFSHQPDTYFVISGEGEQTININSLFFNWTPRKIDFRFDAAVTLNIMRRRHSSDSAIWHITLSPAKSGHHALLLFEGDDGHDDHFDDFFPWETFKIRRVGDFQGPKLRIVPWRSLAGVPLDAGSSSSDFSTYFSSVSVRHGWTNYGADTVQMFAMSNGGNQFDSIATGPIVDATSGTTLVVGAATSLGWFIAGAPATSADSLQILASNPWLTGETGAALTSDFYAYVSRFKTFKDTAHGSFTDGMSEPAAGVPVTFSIHDYPIGGSAASLETTSTVTNSSGIAITRLTLGQKPGIYAVKAAVAADSGGGEVIFFATTTGIIGWHGELSPTGPWYLLSLARRPASLTPSSVMASSTLSTGYWKMYEYDAATDAYEIPDAMVMGDGYWLKTLEDGFIDFSSATALTDTQYIALDAGWNIIGMPFERVYSVSDILVRPAGGGYVSLDTAADSGILYKTFYAWNGSTYDVCPDATEGRTSCYFYPYEGQWIRAIQACTLIIPPPTSLSSPSAPVYRSPQLTSAQYRAPANSAGAKRSPFLLATPPLGNGRPDWTIQLIAQAGKYSDLSTYIGLRPKPEPPVFKAPKAPNGVSVAVREGAERYGRFFRASAAADNPSWSVEVHSKAAAVVTVRAGNIASVPAGTALTLTDVKTGVQTDLRAGPSYSYVSLPDETRSFTLSTEAPGLFSRAAKAVYPAACLVTRAWPSGGFAARICREVRDGILGTPLGRRIAALYYGWAR